MSAGGTFKLIANDGKVDKMILATELLNKRIKEITCQKKAAGLADPTPTLADIEKTHILFVNAHFKPFAAIGYEYNKVRSSSGNGAYGGTVQFSIPQFGDFFNDMVVNVQLASTSASAGTIPAFPAFIGAADQLAGNTFSVSASNDTPVANSWTHYTYQYVQKDGTVVDRTGAATNHVRYCEYPGERLFKKVKFDVNGNPLDEYTSEAAMMHQKFRVAPGKQTAWKRLVGQEVPIEAYSDLCTISGTSVYGSSHTGLQNVTPAAALVSPLNATQNTRRLDQIVNGPQTPKATQPALEMWVPLLFWFNKDPKLSIASVSIPYGQRFITIDIENQNKILYAAPGDLKLRLTTDVYGNNPAAANPGTSAGEGIISHQQFMTELPVYASGSSIDSTQKIEKFELYINNIFVNPEIHDIYIKKIGFTLIRVYRFQSQTIAVSSDSILLNQLKWPIETIFAGLRPKFNVTSPTLAANGLAATQGNLNEWRDWHRLTRLVDNYCYVNTDSNALLPTVANPSVATNAIFSPNGAPAFRTTSLRQTERLTYPVSQRTINTVKISAHGIEIYQQLNSQFFSDYMPYTFGGYNIVAPEDEGALMINFCLYPGTYQPSGHLNISRAREFYFDLTSSFTGAADSNDPLAPAAAQADLLVLGIAINFLLISDGSAVLRYST